MHDHVGDPGPRAADALFDLARTRMSLAQRGGRVERQGQLGDETFVRVDEAQLPRRRAGRLADDPLDERALVCRNVLPAFGGLRDGL